MSETLLRRTKRMSWDTNYENQTCSPKHSPGSSLGKCMRSSTRMEVNDTKSDELPLTLNFQRPPQFVIHFRFLPFLELQFEGLSGWSA
ncbi:hypothetical protein L1887_16302 [Cichorium endivia]|nr:hypothetical protein L1887_16302 [Cichorium endivia]